MSDPGFVHRFVRGKSARTLSSSFPPVPCSSNSAILFRAMVPLSKIDIESLKNRRILMLNGRFDPIIPLSNAEQLAQLFQQAGATIDLELLPGGHELTPRDVAAAREWLIR